ncbi:hypothetical protein J2T56_001442 [Natronobacillus azotifigens]|uniref:Uncharacterized protein n=1 Tax=Natronobacillus azotifigens TaxID=472978 RepID=A0A9J6RCP5_9BACI|nr:hypothetical protein [Natronobacillus azotifigens]MCZ0703126.1 hypothetical protein [Natronobacillus azotifigens]
MERWFEEVEILRKFAEERPNYVMTYLDDHFELGDQFELTVTFEEQDKGTILVNGRDLFMYEGVNYDSTWSGVYFESLPVVVEAVANEGYQFVGWGDDQFHATEEIVINQDVWLKPIFEALETDHYREELPSIRQARILNYILSYILAFFVGALGLWTICYFSSEKINKFVNLIVVVTLLVATILLIPVVTNIVNVGFSTLTNEISFRLLIFSCTLGGAIGMRLPQHTKEIRVFKA